MAFVSLLAQDSKQSLASYHKIEDFTPIKTDITISLNEADVMLRDARLAVGASMDILKVKLGRDIDASIEVSKLLCKELRGATLLIDANQAWSKEQTLYYLKSITQERIALIEQPVVAEDLEALRAITNATQIPILADEAAFTLEEVKRIVETKSADMINIKLMKCGGVTKAKEILEYAREQGVKCMLGSMLEGPHSINAALYLAFAYRDIIAYVDLDSPLLYAKESEELDFLYSGASITFLGD
jgi:L-alanine-DL-glutamate epimerase-like enolase superfamily enzyme